MMDCSQYLYNFSKQQSVRAPFLEDAPSWYDHLRQEQIVVIGLQNCVDLSKVVIKTTTLLKHLTMHLNQEIVQPFCMKGPAVVIIVEYSMDKRFIEAGERSGKDNGIEDHSIAVV